MGGIKAEKHCCMRTYQSKVKIYSSRVDAEIFHHSLQPLTYGLNLSGACLLVGGLHAAVCHILSLAKILLFANCVGGVDFPVGLREAAGPQRGCLFSTVPQVR